MIQFQWTLMLLKVAHRIATHPWVYDKIQRFVGVKKVYARLQPVLQRAGNRDLVLDIGGGTGTLKNHCAPDSRYVCLDIEWDKLKGFRGKFPLGNGIWGNAASMPISSATVDTAICMFMTHHLDDELLPQMLNEVERTLRPGGRMILLDAVFEQKRMAGRILWKLDRGSYPRTPAILKNILSERFTVEHWDQFATWHGYILGVGRKSG